MSQPSRARVSILVVEPYADSGGHYDDWRLIVETLESTGARCIPVVGMRGGQPSAASSVLPRLVRAARGTTRRTGMERATRALDGMARSLDAIRLEAPALAEAAAVARNDTDAAVLLVSSFAPTRHNRRALGNAPVVEFLFEPPGARAGRIASPAPRQAFVATTARIAHAVALRSGVRPPVLAHKPLPRMDAAVGTVDLAGDVSRAVETMREVPSVLVLGALHGKKDLDLVARLPSLVPEGWAVVVAGDPQVDGVAVLARLHARQHRMPVVTVERSLARGEFERLLVCSTVVLMPQRAGEASMSGVLLDAIAACRPVVAPFDSSAGDVIEACGGGATFATDSPAAVRTAIEHAASNTWSADAATWRDHGLVASSEWGVCVIAELERARSRVT